MSEIEQRLNDLGDAIEIICDVRVQIAAGPRPVWHKLLKADEYLEKQRNELVAAVLADPDAGKVA